MRLGTKSLLFGVHQFLLHPFFVAAAWWQLYGWRSVVMCTESKCRACDLRTTSLWDWRLWLGFFAHDMGYWGSPDMDGKQGEQHPIRGAQLLAHRFRGGATWLYFMACHSRFLAKQLGHRPSALCMADKLSMALYPTWLYLLLANATGEIREYMRDAQKNLAKNGAMADAVTSQREWFERVKTYVREYVAEHKDGKADTWTTNRVSGPSGVWQ